MRLFLLMASTAVLSAAEPDVIDTTYGGHPFRLTVPAAGRLGVRTAGDRWTATGRIVVGCDPAVADRLAAAHGLVVIQRRRDSVVLAADQAAPTGALRSLPGMAREVGVAWVEPELGLRMVRRSTPTDPLYAEQWPLPAMNLPTAWDSATGAGVRLGIIDDCLLRSHEDLTANCPAGEGYDFIDHDSDPSPAAAGDGHGTEVAGVAAAARNSVGGVGVAYDATLVGLRLIGSGSPTTTDFADAFTWKQGVAAEVQVFNNSWGPEDDGVDHGPAEEDPGSVITAAWRDGVTHGRGGKGTIYVFAAGNGGGGDTCDRDGYASNPYVISVGATTNGGFRANYSEPGASLFINAPVGDGGSGDSALVTLITPAKYGTAIGTSFAAPMLSGVVALMLQANPNLGWRDVRHILARTAHQNNPGQTDWITNGAGLHWDFLYGFGTIDAAAAVSAAATWTNVPPAEAPLTLTLAPNQAIPDGGSGAPIAMPITADARFRAEWVQLTVDCQHPYQGDLAFTLTSPHGTTVNFLARPTDNAPARVWTLTSVATWGESPGGTWTLVAHDVAAGDTGTLRNVTLTVQGYLASSASAPGTSAAVGSSSVLSLNGVKSTSGGGGAGGGGSTSPVSSSGGGGACGLGGGVALVATGLALVMLRRTLRA